MSDVDGRTPIRLGSLLFTLVDPHRGHEVAYNRWYERDHFYAGCMIGPWQFAGGRFVATRHEKSRVARGPNPVTGEGGRGTYLGLYWVQDGHHDQWNRWAVDQVNDLHANGRMFAHRDHVHTGLYDRSFVVSRDADGVPVELALDHRYAGLVAVIGRLPDGLEATGAGEAFTPVLAGLVADTPVAQVLHASPRPLLDDAPGDVPRVVDDRAFLELFFCDAPAVEVWDDTLHDLDELYGRSIGAEVRWVSPFRPTVVGTDTFTDALWEP